MCFYEKGADIIVLNALKLVTYKPLNSNNAVANCRRKLAKIIDEQVSLASDADNTPIKTKWLRSEDGTECKMDVPKRVKTLVE